MRYRNPIWILNGVVGCGFGVVLAVLVLRLFPNVMRGLWFVDIVLRTFHRFPSLQVLRAETLVERFTARMHVWAISKFVSLFVCGFVLPVHLAGMHC